MIVEDEKEGTNKRPAYGVIFRQIFKNYLSIRVYFK